MNKKPKKADEKPERQPRAVVFMPATRKDFLTVPNDVQDVFNTAITIAREGGKADTAKPLRGFQGASVLEVVANDDTGTYRAAYTVQFARAVYVLHVFQKKSVQGTKTNLRDIELVESRLKVAKLHYETNYRD